MQASVVSIQVGLVREVLLPEAVDPGERAWRTAIFKAPIQGRVWVGREQLEGDEQAAKPAHGGPDRAVLGYAASHYDAWRLEFPRFDFPYGAFGENLTIDGLTEDGVCLGDKTQIGDALLEVAVPRAPCNSISRRCGIPDLLESVKTLKRIGWFYRVLREGFIEAGVEVRLLERPLPQWSISRIFDLVSRLKAGDASVVSQARELLALPALADAWREVIRSRCELLEPGAS